MRDGATDPEKSTRSRDRGGLQGKGIVRRETFRSVDSKLQDGT